MLAGEWQNFKSVVVSAEEAGELLPKWQALSTYALEFAGYNAPELVLPVLKHTHSASVLTVQQGGDLHLAVPFQFGISYNSSWKSPLTAAGTLHVVEDFKEAAISEFIAAQTKPFLFQAIPIEGPFSELLKMQSQRYAILESWSRACLRPVGTYENWLLSNFDQKRRKEFKRLRSRLSELGELRTETLEKSTNADSFISDFLNLEASGWKGKQGTAIAADKDLTAGLREALQNLHAAGKLRFWSLQLTGKSIASLFAIVEGDQAWLGKIAYDEAYAKFSPGALIILDCTQSFFAEPTIKQIDSSAIPNHPLIDRIWRDRLAMVSVFVGPETLSKNRFNFTVALVNHKLRWRNRLRGLYYAMRGRKRS